VQKKPVNFVLGFLSFRRLWFILREAFLHNWISVYLGEDCMVDLQIRIHHQRDSNWTI
jgi:hypothetical protein